MTRVHHEELRKGFRETVQKRTNILCLNALYPGAPTKSEACYARMGLVLDISLGGLQLQCEDSYAPGDHLAVMNLYLDPTSSRPFLFTVQVRWTSRVPNQRLYRCGCSFEPMSVQNEDRLCAAILNLQRADIAAHSKQAPSPELPETALYVFKGNKILFHRLSSKAFGSRQAVHSGYSWSGHLELQPYFSLILYSLSSSIISSITSAIFGSNCVPLLFLISRHITS